MRRALFAALCLALPARMAAQDSARAITLGGFVDTYFAWDFNRPGPASFDRAFTTQPARHDEFNVGAYARQQEHVADTAGVAVAVKPIHVQQKVGRNDPCPCGSGKKYKKCCGANAA